MTHSFPTRRSSDLGDRLPRLLCRTLSLACVQRRGYCDHPRRHLPALLRLAPGQELDMNNGSHLQDRDEARSGQAWRLLFAAWSIALAATLGALFIGEVMGQRSEAHTSELQSLMRISYAVFCLKKNKTTPLLSPV